MERKILIIDDHDDLASSLEEVFVASGHAVEILESRDEAILRDDIESFDLVITDLDVNHFAPVPALEGNGATCLPTISAEIKADHIKAFKICAANFRRDGFDEEELRELFATILDYKLRYVDTEKAVKGLHEFIEFELPSAISPMHVVLEYLIKRVERLGVIKPERSNLFIALDEAFVNAVKHGNKFDTQKLVRITSEVSDKEARFTIEDEGEGFDVNSIPDPLDPENLFKTSGRGVLFIYNIMDEVAYNERGNRLTMVKKSEPDLTQ
ncbi:ATP-binding protein [Leptolyngbya sp. 7M]|uniref:ATP-binding protein n=1 Tax=Leptolyngbya sp. 7M TaxID=2812896 RepID=UPI001B8D0D2F|nr:ATP-binding protein [Leptolyngbya sp. 7M]QYO65568.1 ATP-binding protein [Leptolyngbya sp. 7M]